MTKQNIYFKKNSDFEFLIFKTQSKEDRIDLKYANEIKTTIKKFLIIQKEDTKKINLTKPLNNVFGDILL